MIYYGYEINRTDLAHYGILGMKWGIRRYQNPDGTRTNAGKKRYKLLDKSDRDLNRINKEDRQVELYKARKAQKIKSKLKLDDIEARSKALKSLGRKEEAVRYERLLQERKKAFDEAVKAIESTTIYDIKAERAEKGKKILKVALATIGGVGISTIAYANGVYGKREPITVSDVYSIGVNGLGTIASGTNTYQMGAPPYILYH